MTAQSREIKQRHQYLLSWPLLNGLTNSTKSLWWKKLLKAPQHLCSKSDIRSPSTPQIFLQLVGALKCFLESSIGIFKRLWLNSAYVFLRIGEVSSKSQRVVENVTCMENLTINEPFKSAHYMTLTFRHFKHNKSCRPLYLQITLRKCILICWVRAMINYLKLGSIIYFWLFPSNRRIIFQIRDKNRFMLLD